MKQILLQDNVIHTIDAYIENYKSIFHHIYDDTGLFGLQQIMDSYEMAAEYRRQELTDLIIQRFAPEIILGRTPGNTILLPWRTKTLWISWEDDTNSRIIIDLIIS